MKFELKLTEEEVNLVLTGLSELPENKLGVLGHAPHHG